MNMPLRAGHNQINTSMARKWPWVPGVPKEHAATDDGTRRTATI